MGKQRAKRRRQFWAQLYREALMKVPATGFRAVIEARMGVPIMARKARCRCACGARYERFAPWSPTAVYLCDTCGAVYRVEGGFDGQAFRARPNPRFTDWWEIGQLVRIAYPPVPDLFTVPRCTLGTPQHSFFIGGQGVGFNFDFGDAE